MKNKLLSESTAASDTRNLTLAQINNLISFLFQSDTFENIKSGLAQFPLFTLERIMNYEKSQNLFFQVILIENESLALKVVQYLIDRGLSPSQTDIYQQNILYYTSRDGKYELTKYFIENCNFDLNTYDYFNQSPLFYAVRYI